MAAASELFLNLARSRIGVSFQPCAGDSEIVWFSAPEIRLGALAPVSEVAAALELDVDDIDTDSPVQLVSAGTAALIVPLRSLDALQRSRLNLDAYGSLAAEGFPPLLYQFTRETIAPNSDLTVRFFFEAHGAREDPATGNGAAFLGAYMLEHIVPHGEQRALRIEQGHAVHRPSLIQLRMQLRDGRRDIRVGGGVVPVLRGELL
jgi:trans-2,3-dihydro-3-hydroxyanthranilate isomerase